MNNLQKEEELLKYTTDVCDNLNSLVLFWLSFNYFIYGILTCVIYYTILVFAFSSGRSASYMN